MRLAGMYCGFLIAVGMLVGSLPVQAQNTSPDDLKARIEKLEKQNQELLEALKRLHGQPTDSRPLALPVAPQPPSLGTNDVQKIVDDYLTTREEQKSVADAAKKAEAEHKGFVVGKDLEMKAFWKNHLWFETPDKAFRIRWGAHVQWDLSFVNAPDNVQYGVGGIGPYQDSVNARRARIGVDGWLYEVVDFAAEYDFLNTVNLNPPTASTNDTVANTPVPTNFWVGINHIPGIGVFRAGNMKPPNSFELLTSGRHLNFLERSSRYDAFFEDGTNGYRPGLQILNWTSNERLTWQLGLFKTSRNIYGWNVGNGEWDAIGRVTWLPWYQDEGRYMLHLGVSADHKDLDDDVVRMRARPLVRNGPAILHNIVAIAQLRADNQDQINPEIYLNIGPFSLQAEYTGSWVHNVSTILRTPTQTGVAVAPREYFAQGYYVDALWFITGENRQYVKTGEHGHGAATGRVIPFRNYFWVPGHGCGNPFSAGAWQVGCRYSYLDLNNNDINGGQLHDLTAGLNWYLNPNSKIQWNYTYGFRSIPNGTSSGPYQNFGIRFAFDF